MSADFTSALNKRRVHDSASVRVFLQEILAESKDDTEPDSPDSSTPQAKLDDTIE